MDLPDSYQELWKWFIQLHSSRSSNGFGVNPISYSDIYAYFKLLDIEPQEYEIDLIKKLDSIALEEFAKQQERESKRKSR